MYEQLLSAKVLFIGLVLGCLWWLETAMPMFLHRRNRGVRLGRHLFFAAVNGTLGILLFAAVGVFYAAGWSGDRGLFHRLQLHTAAETALALVLIDLWMYLWHRANHRLPLLWRFHRMHHSDPELDVTSALRFHTGEAMLAVLLRPLLIPILAIHPWQMALYDLLMFPVILLHHSNVRLPDALDRLLRCVIVTPRMHWVHHSRRVAETNSNYSTILSVWDRLFGTFRLVERPAEIQFGLDEFQEDRWQRLRGLLATPFRGGVAPPRHR